MAERRFIVEEGLPLADLERVAASMAATAEQAGVQIVAGDTKVVDRGSADRLFVNTTGVGLVPPGVEIAGDRARPGDVVLLSGTIGDHGMTIMTSARGCSSTARWRATARRLTGWWPRCWRPCRWGRCAACATRRGAAWPRPSTS